MNHLRHIRIGRAPCVVGLLAVWLVGDPCSQSRAQPPVVRYGSEVPPDVALIYERGVRFLATTQLDDGAWPGSYPSGSTGLCLLALLAGGEDPDFGPHSLHVRKAVRSIIRSQNADTGYIPNSMYCHGFGMLALAEAYGAVDETRLWEDEPPERERPSIGVALERAVRCAVAAQHNNPFGGWRYLPSDNSADTSVSGAVLVGLLAARNAGIEVPDQCIDRALEYYRTSTSDDGTVAYSIGMGTMGASMNRSAIAALVFAIGKRQQWPEYQATLGYLRTRLEHNETAYPFYFRYYMAQALFQGDFESWNQWKQENVRVLKELQQEDGSFEGGQGGAAYSTAMALLSLAVEYRLLPIYER